jgi:predicted DNA-binding protein (MmcQ/YjbR family)
MAGLQRKPGATATRLAVKEGGPGFVIYKVAGKMFAIMTLRPEESVVLKCDPGLADMLRQRYEGVGHRTHLDKRFWICVTLDSDVPAREIRRLATQSYGLVCAGLTRKQQAKLAALPKA